MEFFTKTKVVKLRSHLDKYLIADDDQETVRQTRRNASSRAARWYAESVENKPGVVRLKSCHGKYLTASDVPFLLGMTGKKVLQTSPDKISNGWNIEWEPIREGFQVRLKSWCGTFLRGNGGPPPWRSSVTHDEPVTGATQKWILWDVDSVKESETKTTDLVSYLSSMSTFSSVSDDVLDAISDEYNHSSEPGSPVSVKSSSFHNPRLTLIKFMSPRPSPLKKSDSNLFRSGMEFFHNAKSVRLRSHHEKYLHADEDEESVIQGRNGSSKNARWIVELLPGSNDDPPHIIRLKSCYGKYLTASNQPFLLGMTGRKAVQSLPRRLDSSLEWEPIREGGQVKLKTRYGNFLRANGGLPPWRNSVTHDIPQRTATQDWILWDVDIVEIQVQSPSGHVGMGPEKKTAAAAAVAVAAPPLRIDHVDSLDFGSDSPSSASVRSSFSRQESTDSNVSSPPKSDGRTIYYHVADESGDVDDDVVEGYSLVFKGNGVLELTKKLKEETGLEDIVVCTRSPLNGKLYPLRLQLPPNSADMHVIVVEQSSKAARDDKARSGIVTEF